MKRPLTPKQKDVLDYIVSQYQTHGYAPSYREIAQALHLASPSTVHVHVHALKAQGYLKTSGDEVLPRDIAPTDQAVKWGTSVLLPLKGVITAGQPIEAIEEHETISVPVELAPSRDCGFVLRVKGDSMIEEGIFDGDFVVIEERSSARNGEVVVALVDRTYVTLKKWYKEASRIRLQPANKTMQPIYAKDVAVQGVVKGLIRSYT
ncbi:MAG: repressor LexA [Patescibacteria group bacterium]|nr:repressor LexA [Patescibacteria group bacterium]